MCLFVNQPAFVFRASTIARFCAYLSTETVDGLRIAARCASKSLPAWIVITSASTAKKANVKAAFSMVSMMFSLLVFLFIVCNIDAKNKGIIEKIVDIIGLIDRVDLGSF